MAWPCRLKYVNSCASGICVFDASHPQQKRKEERKKERKKERRKEGKKERRKERNKEIKKGRKKERRHKATKRENNTPVCFLQDMALAFLEAGCFGSPPPEPAQCFPGWLSHSQVQDPKNQQVSETYSQTPNNRHIMDELLF